MGPTHSGAICSLGSDGRVPGTFEGGIWAPRKPVVNRSSHNRASFQAFKLGLLPREKDSGVSTAPPPNQGPGRKATPAAHPGHLCAGPGLMPKRDDDDVTYADLATKPRAPTHPVALSHNTAGGPRHCRRAQDNGKWTPGHAERGRTSRQLSGPHRAGQAEDSASSQGLSHLRLWHHQKMRFCRRTWDKNQHRRESRGPGPTTTQTCTRLHEPETAPQKTRTSQGQSPSVPEISYPP